jgi:hypothetical protein
MFGGEIFEKISDGDRGRVIEETMREARSALFHDGQWVIDYRRLRVVAKKG